MIKNNTNIYYYFGSKINIIFNSCVQKEGNNRKE